MLTIATESLELTAKWCKRRALNSLWSVSIRVLLHTLKYLRLHLLVYLFSSMAMLRLFFNHRHFFFFFLFFYFWHSVCSYSSCFPSVFSQRSTTRTLQRVKPRTVSGIKERSSHSFSFKLFVQEVCNFFRYSQICSLVTSAPLPIPFPTPHQRLLSPPPTPPPLSSSNPPYPVPTFQT